MNFSKSLLSLSVFLSFLACIWSPFPIQWALTGIYALVVSRMIGKSVFEGKILGEELKREGHVLQMTNLIGRK